jgi:hypothetical protein
MAITVEQILAKVTERDTVDASLIELTRGIKRRLDEIIAGGLPPAVQAQVDQLFQKLDDGNVKVAAAVVENTPAENPPPV